jgi:hypothetical protein
VLGVGVRRCFKRLAGSRRCSCVISVLREPDRARRREKAPVEGRLAGGVVVEVAGFEPTEANLYTSSSEQFVLLDQRRVLTARDRS